MQGEEYTNSKPSCTAINQNMIIQAGLVPQNIWIYHPTQKSLKYILNWATICKLLMRGGTLTHHL